MCCVITSASTQARACGGRGREGGVERLPASTPSCWTRQRHLLRMLEREDDPSPAGALTPATLVVSLGPEASMAVLGPFWIKPAPRACLPSPRASQPFGPHLSCLAPLCCPLIFHFCPTRPRNPSFSGGLWAAGMLGRGHQPVFPHPRHLNLPLAWRSPWGDGHTHTHAISFSNA